MNALTRRESLLITEARPSSRRDFGLLWYWRAIYHRKWAILLIVALVGVFVAQTAQGVRVRVIADLAHVGDDAHAQRSEEHTSELQSH